MNWWLVISGFSKVKLQFKSSKIVVITGGDEIGS